MLALDVLVGEVLSEAVDDVVVFLHGLRRNGYDRRLSRHLRRRIVEVGYPLLVMREHLLRVHGDRVGWRFRLIVRHAPRRREASRGGYLGGILNQIRLSAGEAHRRAHGIRSAAIIHAVLLLQFLVGLLLAVSLCSLRILLHSVVNGGVLVAVERIGFPLYWSAFGCRMRRQPVVGGNRRLLLQVHLVAFVK